MAQITVKARGGTAVTFDGTTLTVAGKSSPTTTVRASEIVEVRCDTIPGGLLSTRTYFVRVFYGSPRHEWNGRTVAEVRDEVQLFFDDKHAARSLRDAVQSAISA
jgi:hypothetical protein